MRSRNYSKPNGALSFLPVLFVGRYKIVMALHFCSNRLRAFCAEIFQVPTPLTHSFSRLHTTERMLRCGERAQHCKLSINQFLSLDDIMNHYHKNTNSTCSERLKFYDANGWFFCFFKTSLSNSVATTVRLPNEANEKCFNEQNTKKIKTCIRTTAKLAGPEIG